MTDNRCTDCNHELTPVTFGPDGRQCALCKWQEERRPRLLSIVPDRLAVARAAVATFN